MFFAFPLRMTLDPGLRRDDAGLERCSGAAYCADRVFSVTRQIRAACSPIQAAFVQKKT